MVKFFDQMTKTPGRRPKGHIMWLAYPPPLLFEQKPHHIRTGYFVRFLIIFRKCSSLAMELEIGHSSIFW